VHRLSFVTGKVSLEILGPMCLSCWQRVFGSGGRMQNDRQKDSYSNDRRVLVAGFGSAAVLVCLFVLLMSWLAEQVHLMQFCLGRFGH
jgi:hypothetical protein